MEEESQRKVVRYALNEGDIDRHVRSHNDTNPIHISYEAAKQAALALHPVVSDIQDMGKFLILPLMQCLAIGASGITEQLYGFQGLFQRPLLIQPGGSVLTVTDGRRFSDTIEKRVCGPCFTGEERAACLSYYTQPQQGFLEEIAQLHCATGETRTRVEGVNYEYPIFELYRASIPGRLHPVCFAATHIITMIMSHLRLIKKPSSPEWEELLGLYAKKSGDPDLAEFLSEKKLMLFSKIRAYTTGELSGRQPFSTDGFLEILPERRARERATAGDLAQRYKLVTKTTDSDRGEVYAESIFVVQPLFTPALLRELIKTGARHIAGRIQC